ncbi:reverse transcriptase domain-containing protein [Tanacetum coccineum]
MINSPGEGDGHGGGAPGDESGEGSAVGSLGAMKYVLASTRGVGVSGGDICSAANMIQGFICGGLGSFYKLGCLWGVKDGQFGLVNIRIANAPHELARVSLLAGDSDKFAILMRGSGGGVMRRGAYFEGRTRAKIRYAQAPGLPRGREMSAWVRRVLGVSSVISREFTLSKSRSCAILWAHARRRMVAKLISLLLIWNIVIVSNEDCVNLGGLGWGVYLTTVNAECSAIILNKVPEKLEDPEKFLIPCALQELDRTNALADSGAIINLLPYYIYKQLGLGALKPTRMTLELANRFVTYPMGIAEDVVVRVDGFTFLAGFVVVNFEPDPRVPIILGRPFLRTAKALIDLYEKKLTLRVGNDELVFYAEKSEKSKNKQFAHVISIIDFSKDEPFSGSTTIHSDALPPSSSLVKTSDNLEEFADELTLLKKGVQEENFQDYSNPLFEFDDDFNSSNVNPLFNKMDEDVKNENSNVSNSNEPDFLNTHLSNKVECFDPDDNIDEIDAFLAMEVSSDFKEGYYDSEGDVIFLENLLSDDTTHNLSPEVISDESIHNTSITFSPRSGPLHYEFVGEIITLPSRIAREHEKYLNLMTLLYEISTFQSPENFHVNPSSIITSPGPVEEEIDIFLVSDDLIPPGVENDDSEDEDNSTSLPDHESPNLDHQDNPSAPRPPLKPPDVKICLEPDTAVINNFDVLRKDACFNLEEDVQPFLPFFTYPEVSPFILSFGSEDLVFDPGISACYFSLKPVPFALPKDK